MLCVCAVRVTVSSELVLGLDFQGNEIAGSIHLADLERLLFIVGSKGEMHGQGAGDHAGRQGGFGLPDAVLHISLLELKIHCHQRLSEIILGGLRFFGEGYVVGNGIQLYRAVFAGRKHGRASRFPTHPGTGCIGRSGLYSRGRWKAW